MNARLFLFLPVLSLLPLVSGCGKKPGTPAAAPPEIVALAPVVSRPLWDEEEVVGNVEAAQRAALSAKVTGVVDAIHVAPGSGAAIGDVLATIDAREIRARLDSALAAQDQARKDFGRIEKLLKSGSSTRQEHDAANARLLTSDAAVAEARAMLQYTSITAPFDGVVTRKLAEVGDLATPGKPLLEMENSSLLRFEAEIPEALIDRVAMGTALPVQVDAANASLSGTVSEIAPSASAGSRTFSVKLDLPVADKLRAGQFGRVRVPVRERPAILVPADALARRGQIEGVFVVDGGTARLRMVKTGRQLGDQIEILSGLSGGETVVARDAHLLTDGTVVEGAK